ISVTPSAVFCSDERNLNWSFQLRRTTCWDSRQHCWSVIVNCSLVRHWRVYLVPSAAAGCAIATCCTRAERLKARKGIAPKEGIMGQLGSHAACHQPRRIPRQERVTLL